MEDCGNSCITANFVVQLGGKRKNYGKIPCTEVKNLQIQEVEETMLTKTYVVWASPEKRPKVNGHYRLDFSIWTCVKLQIPHCWFSWA